MRMDCKRLFNLSDTMFRRSTGVKRATFEKMAMILTQADKLKKSKGGRPSKLNIEEKYRVFQGIGHHAACVNQQPPTNKKAFFYDLGVINE